MKTIKHPFFIVISTIYFTYYLIKQTDWVAPVFISSFLSDLLCIIIVNTVALWLIRKVKKMPEYELSSGMVFLSVILFSLYFEIILPQVNTYHIADSWDVLCYTLSGITYLFWREFGDLSRLA